MRHTSILLILLGSLAAPLAAQGPVTLTTSLGLGLLERGEFDRRTGVLLVEGSASVPAGPVTVGVGALLGVYESMTFASASELPHWSFFLEARRSFALGESPFVASLAGRVGYDMQDNNDREGDGLMYGVSVGLGRRLSSAVVLGANGLFTRYSLGDPIGDGRLLALRVEAQITP